MPLYNLFALLAAFYLVLLAHRIGQMNKVTYVDLLVPGTIDEKIVQSLRAKINVADQILGETARAWLL